MLELKLKIRNITVFVVTVVILGSISLTVFAQGATSSSLDKPFGDVKDMGALTQAIFQLGIAACVLAAAIYIAIGAYYYFVAAGGNAKTAQQGKEVIQRALIGLVLALVSWIILNTIHPQFTNLDIKSINQSK